MIYLDNSSTTPVCAAAADAVCRMLNDDFGNPSSLHTLGAAAEGRMDAARSAIAARLHCDASRITFTSGGTEANNIAIFGAAEARKRYGRRIVTSLIEHPSALMPAKELERRGFEVVYLKPDENGAVSEEDIFAAVNEDTILISLMYVNNETGALLPVRAAARAAENIFCRCELPKKAVVHCDAVQAFGKAEINPAALGIDTMSISSHKIHGPKGAGALYVGKDVRLAPVIFGGGQERGLRSGTENMPGIAGFGAAAEEIGDIRENYLHAEGLRDRLLGHLSRIPGVRVNSGKNAFPYITNISVPGRKSETMVHRLAAKGIFVSGGSACAKGKRSYVLEAQGLSAPLIDSSLRISLSRLNTAEDIDAFADALAAVIR